ncbi:MAG: hypothetical protein C0624_05060 [Desulfuromonas sp.]|nr:MAG: hypothetical protein C0624_05060 [Desulfuromonas sp.]
MKIGVISDTHFNDIGQGMAFMHDLMSGPLSGVDMLLHAGDLVRDEILAAVTTCPVYAVRGNMDASSGLPARRVVAAGGKRIGLIHGWGPPGGLEMRLLKEFGDEPLDALVFGHSHRPLCLHHAGMLLFNPGSAADRRDERHHTVGLLDVGEHVSGRIINLD